MISPATKTGSLMSATTCTTGMQLALPVNWVTEVPWCLKNLGCVHMHVDHDHDLTEKEVQEHSKAPVNTR